MLSLRKPANGPAAAELLAAVDVPKAGVPNGDGAPYAGTDMVAGPDDAALADGVVNADPNNDDVPLDPPNRGLPAAAAPNVGAMPMLPTPGAEVGAAPNIGAEAGVPKAGAGLGIAAAAELAAPPKLPPNRPAVPLLVVVPAELLTPLPAVAKLNAGVLLLAPNGCARAGYGGWLPSSLLLLLLPEAELASVLRAAAPGVLPLLGASAAALLPAYKSI